MASSTLLPVVLVCVCYPLLVIRPCSVCVLLTSLLFLLSLVSSPLSSFCLSTPLISSPFPTQNQGHPFSCLLGSHSSLCLSKQSCHLQALAMALGRVSPTIGALRTRQPGLGQVPTHHREAARPCRGRVSWQSDPLGAATTCCGVWSKSLDLCLAPCPERKSEWPPRGC